MLNLPHSNHSEATGSIRKGNCLHSGTSTNSFHLQITTLRLVRNPGNGHFQLGQKLHSQSRGSTTRHTIQAVASLRLSNQPPLPSLYYAMFSQTHQLQGRFSAPEEPLDGRQWRLPELPKHLFPPMHPLSNL